MRLLSALTTASALALAAAPAAADVQFLFYDTSGSAGFQNPHFTNRTGVDEFYNWLTASNGGISVTMRAGYWDGSGNTASDYVVNSGASNTGNSYPRIGSYGTGLGVTNTDGDGDHEVDNNGNYTDFMRFMFSASVVVKSVTVRVYDTDGGWLDASYNVGDTPNGTWTNSWLSGISVGSNATFTIGDYAANDYFFFGAGRGWDDTEFKIRSLTVADVPCNTPGGPLCGPNDLPLPGTVGMLGLGAAGIALIARRRRQK